MARGPSIEYFCDFISRITLKNHLTLMRQITSYTPLNSIPQIRISCGIHGILHHTLRAQDTIGVTYTKVLGDFLVFRQFPHALLVVVVDVSDRFFVEMHQSIFQRNTIVLGHISHPKIQLSLIFSNRNMWTINNMLDQPAQPKQLSARAKMW